MVKISNSIRVVRTRCVRGATNVVRMLRPATFCHRRWNTRGREDDTCLMRLKADLSRDRLSFRANDPRPSVSAARARSVAIACNINSGVLRWGENSISPRSDPAHRPLVGISRGFRVAYTWCRQRTSLLQICKRAIYYLTYQASLLAKFCFIWLFSFVFKWRKIRASLSVYETCK